MSGIGGRGTTLNCGIVMTAEPTWTYSRRSAVGGHPWPHSSWLTQKYNDAQLFWGL